MLRLIPSARVGRPCFLAGIKASMKYVMLPEVPLVSSHHKRIFLNQMPGELLRDCSRGSHALYGIGTFYTHNFFFLSYVTFFRLLLRNLPEIAAPFFAPPSEYFSYDWRPSDGVHINLMNRATGAVTRCAQL